MGNIIKTHKNNYFHKNVHINNYGSNDFKSHYTVIIFRLCFYDII
jgi:hypothetical protein